MKHLRHLSLFAALASATALAQVLPTPEYTPVTANADGTLRGPANLWTANAASMAAALAGQTIGGNLSVAGNFGADGDIESGGNVRGAKLQIDDGPAGIVSIRGGAHDGDIEVYLPASPGTLVTNASTAEVLAGTNDTRAVTPLGNKAALDAKVNPITNSRAARQAGVYDGSAGAVVNVSEDAIGLANFSRRIRIRADGSTSGGDGNFIFTGLAAGNLQMLRRHTSQLIEVAQGSVGSVGVSTRAVPLGVEAEVVYVRGDGVGTLYIDGVPAGTWADARDYAAPIITLSHTSNSWIGVLGDYTAYNYALSAAQVARLFATGAVDPVDRHEQVAGTQLLTGDNSTFASNTGFWSLFGGATISSGACQLGASGGVFVFRDDLLRVGYRYRFTATIVSGANLVIGYATTPDTFVGEAPGTYTVEFVCTATGTPRRLGLFSNGSAVIDNLTLECLGATVAADPQWDGLGGYWPDTSGNGNHIALGAGVQPLIKRVRGEAVEGIYAPAAPILSVSVSAGLSVTTGDVLAYVDVTGAAWGEWLVANSWAGRYYIGGYYGDGGNNLGVAMELTKAVGFQSSVYGLLWGLEAEVISTSVTRLKLVAIDTQTLGRSYTVHLLQLTGGLNRALVK